ncbi:PIN domain-containing protein [Bdellovibrionota bacterium FG-1]
MIAVDTSSFIAYLEGAAGKDLEILDEALAAKQVVLPPMVLTELLSDSSLPKKVVELFKTLPLLEISEGYWERCGISRAAVLAKGHKARVADALIAQSCLDHEVGLLTRDGDFRAFATRCGLILVR